jgi:hypothetical protein
MVKDSIERMWVEVEVNVDGDKYVARLRCNCACVVPDLR